MTTTAFDESFGLFFTSPGEEGALLQTAEMEQPWLEHDDPAVLARFNSLATVGTEGSTDEQPLRAAKRGLVDLGLAGEPNQGFVREDVEQLRLAAAAEGIHWQFSAHRYDRLCWPRTRKGFNHLRKQIPHLVKALTRPAQRCTA